MAAIIALAALNGCSMSSGATTSGGPGPELKEVNACLAQYNVEMFRGADGRFRIWGDINRIQDIIDGPCVELFPKNARTDLDDFFASEVDLRLAECLQNSGIDAKLDPATGPGIEITGQGPSEGVMDRCFEHTYSYFAVRPDQRT